MTLEEALAAAIDYETRIRDLYAEAAKKVKDPVGRRFLEILAREEKGHLDYLMDRREAMKQTGVFDAGTVVSAFSLERPLAVEVSALEKRMPRGDLGDEKQILSRALQVERETSAFYEKMVQTFSRAAQEMFRHFLEIENAHIEAVQAELDHLSKTGYWFDIKEFDME